MKDLDLNRLLLMRPHARRIIWAGKRLDREFSPQAGDLNYPVAESLEVSALNSMPSHVAAGGADVGLSLVDLMKQNPGVFSPKDQPFPLLIKRLDTGADLSLQVHPNDELALELDGAPNGKNEVWVILDAEPGARVYLGFEEGVTEAQVKDALEKGTALKLMRSIEVKSGDVIPVPAGCAHAIGSGLYILEVQQTSDLTYRLYDYDRQDKDGKRRELHIEKGLKALDLSLRPERLKALRVFEWESGVIDQLVVLHSICVERWTVRAGGFTEPDDRLRAFFVNRGECLIESDGEEPISLEQGRTLLRAPGGPLCRIQTDSEVEILVASLQ